MKEKMNFAKVTCLIMFWASIVFCIAHLVVVACDSASVEIESMVLNVVPYGLPIALFAYANRLIRKDCWKKTDTVFVSLFSLCYLVMAIHVTIEFAVPPFDFVAVYFNVPILYMIPLVAIAIVWAIVHMRPDKQSPKGQKVLFFLPLIAFAAMLVHCGIVCIVEACRNVQTSFPWWTTPLIVGVCYLLGIVVLMAAYAIFYGVQKRRLQIAK